MRHSVDGRWNARLASTLVILDVCSMEIRLFLDASWLCSIDLDRIPLRIAVLRSKDSVVTSWVMSISGYGTPSPLELLDNQPAS